MSVELVVLQPSASCRRCGDCCRQIWIECHPEHIGHHGWNENAAFIARHWHWTGEQRPEQAELDAAGDAAPYPSYRYTCDQFDEARSICMAHETRPPICRGFPWYGQEPSIDAANRRFAGHAFCSFWLDVPRADWPRSLRPNAIAPVELQA